MTASQPPRRGGSQPKTLWQLSGMGFELTTEILAGALFGWLFDYFLGTSPYGLIVGAILGVLVAMTNFLRRVLALETSAPKREKSERSEDGDGSSDERSSRS